MRTLGKNQNRLMLMISTLVLVACVLALAGLTNAGPLRPALADITGFSRYDTDLVFNVVSNGCTKKEDFELAVIDIVEAGGEPTTVTLELLRTKPDHCRRLPFVITINYPESEHGINAPRIVIRNHVVAVRKVNRGT